MNLFISLNKQEANEAVKPTVKKDHSRNTTG